MKFRFLTALLTAAAIAFGCAPPAARASQASCTIPLTGPHPMSDVATDLNNCLNGLFGLSSGTTAPSNAPSAAPVPYQLWMDTATSPPTLGMYDGAQWAGVGTINPSTHVFQLVPSTLPAPSATTLGGIESITSLAHTWIAYIDMSGVPHQSQPAASDLTNGVTGSGSVVLATSPTVASPTFSGMVTFPGGGTATTSGFGSLVALGVGESVPSSGIVNISGQYQIGGTQLGYGAGLAGFGTAAAQNTGTSGSTIPFLNGSNTWSGTNNFTGTFEIGGNAITFPVTAATLAYLAGTQTYTGNNTFNGTTALAGGGSLAGTFSGTPTLSGANFITLGNIVQDATAYSLLGNATSGAANYAPFTVGSLPLKASPSTNDIALLQDGTTGALERTTAGALSTVGSVASIDAQTGAFTTGTGLTVTSGNTINAVRNYFDNAGFQVAQIFGSSQSASVSGSASGTGGAVKLTVSSTTGFITGNLVTVNGVTGTTEANGSWLVTVNDSTHLTLNGSTYVHSYSSGGAVYTSNGTAVGVTSSTADNIIVDRFHTNIISPASGTLTTQQVEIPTPGGSYYRMQTTTTVAESSLNAASLYYWEQKLYWKDAAAFQWGTPNAVNVTVRFGVNMPAGTWPFCVIDSNDQWSYCVTYTISAGQANSNVVETFTIPGPTVGTWHRDADATTAIGPIFTWGLGVGSTYTTCTANTWTNTLCLGVSGISNFAGSTSNVGQIFDVGLYIGSAAPTWEPPNTTVELQKAQRYVFNVGLTTNFGGPLGVAESATTGQFSVPLPNMLVSEVTPQLYTSGTPSDYELGIGTGSTPDPCTSIPAIFNDSGSIASNTLAIIVFTSTSLSLTANTLVRGWAADANGLLFVLTQI